MRARLLARYSSALFPASDPELPVRVAEEALALARRFDDPPMLMHVLHFARPPLFFWLTARQFMAMDEEALAVARRVGSAGALISTLTLSALTAAASQGCGRSSHATKHSTSSTRSCSATDSAYRPHVASHRERLPVLALTPTERRICREPRHGPHPQRDPSSRRRS